MLLLATSIGSTDAILTAAWGKLATEYGIPHAYAQNPKLNHPPLSLAIMSLLDRAAGRIAFADLLRALQILADLATAAMLVALAGRDFALLFFLSPAAIFISGFHCNTDPTMTMLIVAAVLLAVRGRGTAAGVVLALATGIKIVPLLLVPIFVAVLWRRAAGFIAAYTATAALIFLPAMAIGGRVVFDNIFGYAGSGNWWGIVSMLRLIGHAPGLGAAYPGIVRPVVVAVVIVLSYLAWRSPNLPVATGTFLVSAIVLGSGFGVQYLVWPLPFLPFLVGRRGSLIVHAAVSTFLAMVYTHWSGDIFPWNYADAVSLSAVTLALVVAGWIAWATLAWSALAGVRCIASPPR